VVESLDTICLIQYFGCLFFRKTTMTHWRWAVLIFELFLFALILILPQVDLPDTAFRDGHTPVMAKLQVNSPPVTCAGFAILNTSLQNRRTITDVTGALFGQEQSSEIRSSLIRTLRC
jgi:hypothetical protein